MRLLLALIMICILSLASCVEDLTNAGSCTISEIDGVDEVSYCYEYDSPAVSNVPDKLKKQCNADGGNYSGSSCSISNPVLKCKFEEGVEEATMYFDADYDIDDAEEICEDLDGKVK